MSNNKSFAFGMGLLAGVVGGIIAGVLFAPKPGEESRRELKEAACELYEKNSPAIAEAKKQALGNVDLMRYKLERQFRKFNFSGIKFWDVLSEGDFRFRQLLFG